MQKIVSLMFEIDTYKEARMYKKVEELRQRIEILEYSLQLCKDDLTAS
jgi:hypothetical protein